jgi:hypothetical protein
MDNGQFDDLTRSVVKESGTRRALLRLLAGGAFAGAVSRLGMGESTGAKPKRKRKKKHRKNLQGQEPQDCGADCTKSGGRCCEDGSCSTVGQCCPGEWGCDDGSCVPAGQCCPGAVPPPCGACELVVCDNGELHYQPAQQCPGNQQHNPTTCQCECPIGSELMADGVTCCPRELACNHN